MITVSWRQGGCILLLFVTSGAFAVVVYLLRNVRDICYVVTSLASADMCTVIIDCSQRQRQIYDCSKMYATGDELYICYNAFETTIGGCNESSPTLIAVFVVLSLLTLFGAISYIIWAIAMSRQREERRQRLRQQRLALSQQQTAQRQQHATPAILVINTPIVTVEAATPNYILGSKEASSVYVVIENP